MSGHFGTAPAAVRNAVLDALEVFRAGAGTGVLRTLKAYAGARDDVDAIDLHVAGGLPAILVGYSGGAWASKSTSRRLWQPMMGFSIICVSGAMGSRERRLTNAEGGTQMGIEDLLDLATYYGLRTVIGLAGLAGPDTVAHVLLRWEPGRYVASVDFTVRREFDLYDDASGDTFEALGIVQSPTDTADLWTDVAETVANSDLPAEMGGEAEYDMED